MEKINPSVSVITVCRNAASDIAATLDSIISQSAFDRIELIVIDGASTDGTVDIINRYRTKISHFVSEKDSGIYDAMNKGIALSSGKWVNFLNAGDSFFDTATIASVLDEIAHLENEPDVVFGHTVLASSNGTYSVASPSIAALPRYPGACHQSMFFRGAVIHSNLYDTSFRIKADHHLVARLWARGFRFATVHKYIALYNDLGISSQSRTLRLRHDEWCRIMGRRSNALNFWLRTLRVTLGRWRRQLMHHDGEERIYSSLSQIQQL